MTDLTAQIEELLAAAKKDEHIHGRGPRRGERRPAVCPACSARQQLLKLGIAPVLVDGRPTFPAARALVESQKFIEDQDCENQRDYGGDFCIEWPKSNKADWCDRCAALELRDLEKVMKPLSEK